MTKKSLFGYGDDCIIKQLTQGKSIDEGRIIENYLPDFSAGGFREVEIDEKLSPDPTQYFHASRPLARVGFWQEGGKLEGIVVATDTYGKSDTISAIGSGAIGFFIGLQVGRGNYFHMQKGAVSINGRWYIPGEDVVNEKRWYPEEKFLFRNDIQNFDR